jgi:cold shock CspA family protein
MKTGIVTMYNPERGFGFIRETGEHNMVSHFYHVADCLVIPKVGLGVQFEVVNCPRGTKATKVQALSGTSLLAVKS